ncbi:MULTISPECIES: hypothetical protein [Pseudomonas]|uniref:Uncharacterized protein n=1 Tax=Pseudomonas piscis TaxID=2614538 RepID=A0A7X1PMZ1_9PSED|nr:MULTISPECIES: hypothetical protein [Pseudomonas]AZC20528.1 hypothetical protein C4K40_5163 [Pseudomonas sp. CMR5c]MQA55191.1 hypothetical protein [Pseudomonas piscis]
MHLIKNTSAPAPAIREELPEPCLTQPALTLLQRVTKLDDASLHCREVSLRLSEDQNHLVLTRYSEHYSPQGMEWVERKHRVSVTDLLRWVIEQGQPQSIERGDDKQA